MYSLTFCIRIMLPERQQRKPAVQTDRHQFNGLFSRTTYIRKVKPFCILMNQEMTGWQWHQLDHMQII